MFSMKECLNSTREKTLDYQSIARKQKAILLVYKDVFSACEKHGLRLFLQGGTLLGKIRHDGFIPWDDDMDLGLCRADYEKLKDVYECELKEKYHLYIPGGTEGSHTRFAQFFPRDNEQSEEIWLDIFPIDYAPDNRLQRALKGIKCNALMLIGGSIEFMENCTLETKEALKRTTTGRVNLCIREILHFLFRRISLQRWYIIIDRAAKYTKETSKSTSALGRWHYFGELQNADVFFPLKKSTFCGCDAWTLNNPENYLRHNYGDNYMEIPPIEKRESHS